LVHDVKVPHSRTGADTQVDTQTPLFKIGSR